MGDNQEIEVQPITISPGSNAENMDAQSSVGAHGHSASAGCEQPPDENADRKGCCSCKHVCVFGLCAVIYIIIVIPIIVLFTLAYLACGIDVSGKSTNQEGGNKGIYPRVHDFHETGVQLAKQVWVIGGSVSFWVLVWFVVNISVPSLRRKTVFGSQLWKWTLLAVIVTCGYFAISIASHVFLDCVPKMDKGKNDFVYYLRGLRRSISFTIYSVSILSTWLFYFRSRHGLRGTKTHISNHAFDLMTWTLVSLVVFALLWLLKTVLLLKWKAHAVHERFRGRILRARFQRYFVAVISGTWLDRNSNAPEDGREVKEKKEEKRKAKDILHIGDNMEPKDLPTYGIKQMTKYFVDLAKQSSREDDDISNLRETCRRMVGKVVSHDEGHMITKDDLRQEFRLDENEVELLFKELQGKHAPKNVSYETFENWMVSAHKHCLALGYTLIDAKKVVDCLNKLMIGFLIAATILSWLLLTKIATRKLLVIIASPILAIHFIFGDTSKALFGGFIFTFVKHPFDVGDLCIFDDIEMEVKCMGILSTSFLKMGTKEIVVYWNSVLATKSIVNLKGDPDPTDFVELSLDHTTKGSKITDLEGKIKEYISSNDHEGKFENSNHIFLKEIGTSKKITIHFKHMMSTLDMTHSQFVDKKNRQRSDFLFKVQEFLEELEIKTSTAS